MSLTAANSFDFYGDLTCHREERRDVTHVDILNVRLRSSAAKECMAQSTSRGDDELILPPAPPHFLDDRRVVELAFAVREAAFDELEIDRRKRQRLPRAIRSFVHQHEILA
jgi:hypothetical protein